MSFVSTKSVNVHLAFNAMVALVCLYMRVCVCVCVCVCRSVCYATVCGSDLQFGYTCLKWNIERVLKLKVISLKSLIQSLVCESKLILLIYYVDNAVNILKFKYWMRLFEFYYVNNAMLIKSHFKEINHNKQRKIQIYLLQTSCVYIR